MKYWYYHLIESVCENITFLEKMKMNTILPHWISEWNREINSRTSSSCLIGALSLNVITANWQHKWKRLTCCQLKKTEISSQNEKHNLLCEQLPLFYWLTKKVTMKSGNLPRKRQKTTYCLNRSFVFINSLNQHAKVEVENSSLLPHKQLMVY